MPNASIKRVPTLFLKAVVVLIGAAVLAVVIISFPNVWQGAPREWPQLTSVLYPGLIGIYATVVPFLYALYQILKLLHSIDTNTAFSEASVKSLSIIKYCAVAMSVLYAMALPLAFIVAQLDDAPGLVLMATAFACSPLVVATFAAVLQKLVQSAVDIKSEHDLTV